MLQTAERQFRQVIDPLLSAGQLPGIQYVVVTAAGIQYEFCGGQRDLGAGRPVTPATTFLAASSTKVLTAAAVLQLVQQGKVGLDAPLGDYYPRHPYGPQVTVRRLVNQSSGIPNPLPLRWLHSVEEHAAFDEDAALQAALARAAKPAFAPGAQYGYSNLSYWLLGKVIEAASGMRYGDYMRRAVAAPLGLTPAELDVTIADLDLHARGYQAKYTIMGLALYLLMDRRLIERSEARRFRLKPVYMNGPAYGGLNGTARGFAAFLRDQLRPDPVLLDLPTRTLFFTPQHAADGKPLGTTLGWHSGRNDTTPYFAKPGGGPGYQSNLRVYPAQGIATVWLVNQTGVNEGDINRLGDALDRPFLG